LFTNLVTNLSLYLLSGANGIFFGCALRIF